MAEYFGTFKDGQNVERLFLEDHGLTAAIITYGATLQDLRFASFDYPLVLGFNDIESYQGHSAYFGANVGRVANRIANAECYIGGSTYQLDRNELGRQTLHGGSDGTGHKIWTITEHQNNLARFKLRLPEGHMGFPGTLDITLTYKITFCAQTGPGLELEYSAQSDRDTLCNLAHHSYFNLDGTASIQEHNLQILADHYLPVDKNNIPTGEIRSVKNTEFDFRAPRKISGVSKTQSYDHNFCLSDQQTSLRPIARLTGSDERLSMELMTTESGLQVYNGAGIKSDFPGLSGSPYNNFAGIALEPQAWPDAPNHNHFPDITLKAGIRYRQQTRFTFCKT